MRHFRTATAVQALSMFLLPAKTKPDKQRVTTDRNLMTRHHVTRQTADIATVTQYRHSLTGTDGGKQQKAARQRITDNGGKHHRPRREQADSPRSQPRSSTV